MNIYAAMLWDVEKALGEYLAKGDNNHQAGVQFPDLGDKFGGSYFWWLKYRDVMLFGKDLDRWGKELLSTTLGTVRLRHNR